MPNFFIVGAAKSGTSSLDRYLSQHPDVFIPPKKEAHFFSTPDFPDKFEGPGDEGMNLYTIRDREQYRALFEGAEDQRAVGESSAFYLYYPGTAQRMKADVPDAKIIILLRNPVNRAFSAYMHLIRDERESLDFAESLHNEDLRKAMDYEPMWLYREVGLYAAQVQRFLDVFGPDQVKVVLFEDFVRNPEASVQDICRFLEVDPSFRVDTSLSHNESGAPASRWVYNFIAKPNGLKEALKPLFPTAVRERLGMRAKSIVLRKVAMNENERAELAQYFASDIADLADVLHHDLRAWHTA